MQIHVADDEAEESGMRDVQIIILIINYNYVFMVVRHAGGVLEKATLTHSLTRSLIQSFTHSQAAKHSQSCFTRLLDCLQI